MRVGPPRDRRPHASRVAWALTAALVTAPFGSVPSASAQPRPTPTASDRALLQRGIDAYDVGDYQTALRAFQDAFLALRDPTILLNVGAASERLDRYEEALRAYRLYLERIPNAPDRARVEGRIRQLQALLATPLLPRPEPSAAPSAAPSARPPAVPPPVVEAPRRPWWPWLLVGGGALVAGSSVVPFLLEANPNADPNVRSEEQYNAAIRRGDANRVVGYALLGAGGALAVTGLILGLALPARSANGRRARGAGTVEPMASVSEQGFVAGGAGEF